MIPSTLSLTEIQQRIDEVKRFLAIALNIANAHTVEFYTHDVWSRFMAVAPEAVLSAVTTRTHHQREQEIKTNEELQTTFGFCPNTHRLVSIYELLHAAMMLSLPGLGICLSKDELLQSVQQICSDSSASTAKTGAPFETDEFMNSKKSHEVQFMSEVVAYLARGCQVKQVIDVGSGKGYLSSFLSMQYGLQVYGIDSSITNTHGAQERNRKLKKFSKAYQKHNKESTEQKEDASQKDVEENKSQNTSLSEQKKVVKRHVPLVDDLSNVVDGHLEPDMANKESTDDLFLSALSLDLIQTTSLRVPPSQLSNEERERRKRENLERKAQNRTSHSSAMFSPLTSFVTAETELRELISELKAAVLVGLHTCGDLAPSSLRMFVAKAELAAVCSVGCCYHLLSEEFDPTVQDCNKSHARATLILSLGQFVRPIRPQLHMLLVFPLTVSLWVHCPAPSVTDPFRDDMKGCLAVKCSPTTIPVETDDLQSVCGFPLSQYLRDQSWFCGRNARMSACLALERVSHGQGIQMESLFYRAVLHVILRDHYGSFKSEKRVGNVYSKAKSFVDYVRRALQKLELDETKLSDCEIQAYQDTYRPRINEMHAFNMLKVRLAPCIEGLILLDRLCYLKEQENVSFSALVQLFDPLLSPRCYAVVGLKKNREPESN